MITATYIKRSHRRLQEWGGPRQGAPQEWAAASPYRLTRRRYRPEKGSQVESAIRDGRWLLSATDEKGDSRCSRETWDSAVGFLRRHSTAAYERGEVTVLPVIGPGPNGSIDLHWECAEFELLVNIPAAPAETATFYGDDYGSQTIKGTISADGRSRGLLQWLAKR